METGADVVADRRSCDAGRRPAYEHWKRARKGHGHQRPHDADATSLRSARAERRVPCMAWRLASLVEAA